MEICRELNATPSALLSVLLARACWKQNPHIHKNIVHNLCLDMRKSLHNEQKQESHVRYLCKKNILEFDKIRKIKDLKMRESVVQAHIHGREGFLSSVNGRFFFTWTQDFTEECFVSFFLEELKMIGVSADEFCDRPVLTAKMKLPDTINS